MKPKTLIYSISLFIFTITQFQLSAQSVQIPPESYIAKCKEWADALNAHDVKPYQLACFEEILWLLRHPKYKPNLEDMPTHSYIATMVYFKKDNKIYNEFNLPVMYKIYADGHTDPPIVKLVRYVLSEDHIRELINPDTPNKVTFYETKSGKMVLTLVSDTNTKKNPLWCDEKMLQTISEDYSWVFAERRDFILKPVELDYKFKP